MPYFIASFIALFLITSCKGPVPLSDSHRHAKKDTSSSRIVLMTYNVENLFDTNDDPGKDDETYLPKAKKVSRSHKAKCGKITNEWWKKDCLEKDWTRKKLEEKFKRLADVILQVEEGKGPDVLFLQEVENLAVIEELRKNHLQAAQYGPSILIEGEDKRGIDVAILTRLPQKQKARLHNFHKGKKHPTRGLLQATLELPNGELLHVVATHLPSQGAPSSARWQGVKAIAQLKKSISSRDYVVVAGDFNITKKEEIREGFFTKKLAKDFLVSHFAGCKKCEGTHNYKRSWSFLDVMLFSKNLQSGAWQLDTQSIRIPKKSRYQVNKWGSPARFKDGLFALGVSDHFPLAADLVLTSKK